MHLEQKKLLELSSKYSTPLYVYNLDLVSKKYQSIYDFIPYKNLKVLYAMKANYNIDILKTLLELGSGIDAVSPGDVLLAKKVGFPAEKILYTANNITDKEMNLVQKEGVTFNIGSLSRLEKYSKAFPGSSICLRFNPEVVAGAHEKIMTGGDITKFGILFTDIPKVKEIADRYDIKIIGIHKHTGSGINQADKFIQAINNLLGIATKENFPDLKFIDFGGGIAVPYHPEEERINYSEFGKTVTNIFEDYSKSYGKELEMWFEPGKFIVAESGYLLIEVNTLKDNKGRLIAGTNSGFSQLIRPMFYEAYHHIENLSNPSGELKAYDICGNICETGDCFASERSLPEIREGDILSIQNAGAYCYAMASIYNLRSLPAEVVINNDSDKLSTKRLSTEELIDSLFKE